MQHLEGDETLVPQILREVDSRHPAPAELAIDCVVRAKCIANPIGLKAGSHGTNIHPAFEPSVTTSDLKPFHI